MKKNYILKLESNIIILLFALYSCSESATINESSKEEDNQEVVVIDSISSYESDSESQEFTSMTDEILTGSWINDNPWEGKGTERYKTFEMLEFRSDRSVYQDGRLIGTGWSIVKDKEGDSIIEYANARNKRITELLILSSSETTLNYGFKSGNGEYSLTKK